jgi:hypothetical protein
MTWIFVLLGLVAVIGLIVWLRSRQPKPFRTLFVDEFPDSLRPRAIYVASEPSHPWAASMLCPCGCGEVIQLNLLPQVRPCWQVQAHEDGTVSITPSVWRQKGCGSHFFVRRGRIDWC